MAITNESLKQATEKIDVSFEVLNLKDIKKNPKNPRKITKAKLEHLQESIETIPEMLMADEIIVDENNMIISGHQRFEVLKKAGVEKVRVKKCVGYTEAQKEEIMVRKNVVEGENGKKVRYLKNGAVAHTLTVEDSRKGGKHSAEMYRKRKTFAETLDIILKRVPKDKDIIKKLKKNGFEKEDINTQLILLNALVNNGIKKGDPSIAAFIRDTVGEKPKDQVEILEPPEIPPLPEE